MTKVAFYSSKDYDRLYFERAIETTNIELQFLDASLNSQTSILAKGADAICVFVNDVLDGEVIANLAELGIKLIALRCAGFNNVDLLAAKQHNIKVVRVPAYSPDSVAEHTVGLILTLNRRFHKAYNRVRDGNFSLSGLIGFDLNGRTAGIIGMGNIGSKVATILQGFGMKVLAYDPYVEEQQRQDGVQYVELNTLLTKADIVSLHCPLNETTKYLINAQSLEMMKKGVMLINTSRGALLDTKAVITALKSHHIGHLGLDVYEQEQDLFFNDLSQTLIADDVFGRLITFPNVLITGHQGFLTEEALTAIADTTIYNIEQFAKAEKLKNQVVLP